MHAEWLSSVPSVNATPKMSHVETAQIPPRRQYSLGDLTHVPPVSSSCFKSDIAHMSIDANTNCPDEMEFDAAPSFSPSHDIVNSSPSASPLAHGHPPSGPFINQSVHPSSMEIASHIEHPTLNVSPRPAPNARRFTSRRDKSRNSVRAFNKPGMSNKQRDFLTRCASELDLSKTTVSAAGIRREASSSPRDFSTMSQSQRAPLTILGLPSSSQPMSGVNDTSLGDQSDTIMTPKAEDIVCTDINNMSAKNQASAITVDKWIIKYHIPWCRLTLSSFFRDLEDRSLPPSQFAQWLIDRTSVSMTVLQAATRINELLLIDKSLTGHIRAIPRSPRSGRRTPPSSPSPLSLPVSASKVCDKDGEHSGDLIPLLKIATEDAEFLTHYTMLNGLDYKCVDKLSEPARALREFIEMGSAPDAPVLVGLSIIWAFMFSSWQGWSLVKQRKRSIPQHFARISEFLSRNDSVTRLLRTQKVLDCLLKTESCPGIAEKAGESFEQVITLATNVLDHSMSVGCESVIPACVCGRKGHLPAQCTFKSRI